MAENPDENPEKAIRDPQKQFEECMRWWHQPAVPGHAEKAAHWCALAAKEGHAGAQAYLGIFYHLGKGVEQDLGEAIRLLRKAALNGDLQAAYYLGNLFYERRDFKDAEEWTRIAALRGHIKAMNNLAHLYYYGEGVERNPLYAYLLFEPSLFEGNWVADATRRRIRSELTPAEQELVEERRRTCHVYMRRFDKDIEAVLGRIIDDKKTLASLNKALEGVEEILEAEGAQGISHDRAFKLYAFQECALPSMIMVDNGYVAVRRKDGSWVYYRDTARLGEQLRKIEGSSIRL